MKKYRKSIWLPVALLVYTTAMAVYAEFNLQMQQNSD